MTTTAPPRPTLTREMIMEAATLIAKQVPTARRGFVQDDAENELATAIDIADIYADLSHGSPDGYEIAKSLDNKRSWQCTLDDAEKLDSLGWLVDQRLTESEKKWVSDNNIQPPLPIGTEIMPIYGHPVKHVIFGVYDHEPARYLVKADGVEGQFVVKFEDVKAA